MDTSKIKIIRDIIIALIYLKNSPKDTYDLEKYKQEHFTFLKITLFAIVILPYFLQL